jgi:hypothetical protein
MKNMNSIFCLTIILSLFSYSIVTAQVTISGTIQNYNFEPLPYVQVKLEKGDGIDLEVGYTDANGDYELTTSSTPPKYQLKFRAINAAAKVHPTIDPDPFDLVWGDFPFPAADTSRGIEQVALADSSRGDALWLAGEVSKIRSWFIGETGQTPDRVPVEWRAGAGRNQAYYWGLGEGIHLGRNRITAIYHEYGHFLHDQFASWINVPYYGDDVPGDGHVACAHQTCFVWPYFEGFGHLIGALAYEDIFGSVHNANPYTASASFDWIEDPSVLIGRQYLDNGNLIYTCGTDYWDLPLETESGVAAILYDLVDAYSPADTIDNKNNEIAEITFQKLFQAVTHYKDPKYTNPCTGSNKHHPITMQFFWDAYRDEYPGPVPYLWSAFAKNNLDWDYFPPDEPSVISASHEEDVWKNLGDISITFREGDDDVSGVFYFHTLLDPMPGTLLPSVAVPSDTVATNTQFTYTASRSSGIYYLHLVNIDLAGKLSNPTTHYGPVKIDVDNPYVTSFYPDGGQTFLISDEVEIKWESYDDHSGVESVTIVYEDHGVSPATVIKLATDLPAIGSWVWQLDSTIAPTNQGYIIITARDSVGNESVYDQQAPFEIRQILELAKGDYRLPNAGPGDLAWADFDNDGFDDLAYLGKNDAEILRSAYSADGYKPFPFYTLEPMEKSSLLWGDFDNNGLLDLFTMGSVSPGMADAIFYFQNPVNVFNKQSSMGITGTVNGDAKTGDLDLDGDLDIVVTGRYMIGSSMDSVIFWGYEWDGSGSYQRHTLYSSGLEGGEIVLLDYDGDGDEDIVFSGVDANKIYRTKILRNNGGWNFQLQPVSACPILKTPRLDAGDFTGNGFSDFAVMGSPDTPAPDSGTVVCNAGNLYMGGPLWGWSERPDMVFGIWDGDITFVDIDNDGDLDVTSAGRNPNGLETEFWINRDSTVVKRNLEEVNNTSYGNPSFAWGDIDGDMDLDMIIMGVVNKFPVMNLYYNLAVPDNSLLPGWPNDIPDPPVNLEAFYNPGTGGFLFTWDPPSNNDTTPDSSLTYDLRVGTGPGLNDILSAAMPVSNGNTGYGTEHVLYLGPGTYYWTVRTVDGGWKRSSFPPELTADENLPPWTTDVRETDARIPETACLFASYPNPFNPRTTIGFAVPNMGSVDLRIYNLLGKELEVLTSRDYMPGYYDVEFDGSELSSGIYVYRIRIGDFVDSKKVVLLK